MDQDLTSLGQADWRERLLQQHGLTPAYLVSAQYWFDPLADALVAHHKSAGRPILLAVNGSQGSGKSTLCAYLQMALAAKHQLSAVSLSLDDFYYPHAKRQALAREIHPLLATRGVPGTHDVKLLRQTLEQLLDVTFAEQVEVPRFDKAADDRRATPDLIAPNVEIVLLEGWCLGATPQPVDALAEPANALERDEDSDGVWRSYVNGCLARDFPGLYRLVDQWVMLQAPDFDCVFDWRMEQEEKLARSNAHGRHIMDAAGVERFIQFYQRLTERCLGELPAKVDHLFYLGRDRSVKRYQQPNSESS